MTQQRLLISNLLREHGHMTADAIFELARIKNPKIALGTVYRNLGLMEHDGEIQRFGVFGMPDVFDITVSSHPHKICVSCGNVSDISGWSPTPPIDAKDEIIATDIIVRCICKKCKNKKLN